MTNADAPTILNLNGIDFEALLACLGLRFSTSLTLNDISVRTVEERGRGVFVSARDIYRVIGITPPELPVIATALQALGCADPEEHLLPNRPLDAWPVGEERVVYDVEPTISSEQAVKLGQALASIGGELVRQAQAVAALEREA